MVKSLTPDRRNPNVIGGEDDIDAHVIQIVTLQMLICRSICPMKTKASEVITVTPKGQTNTVNHPKTVGRIEIRTLDPDPVSTSPMSRSGSKDLVAALLHLCPRKLSTTCIQNRIGSAHIDIVTPESTEGLTVPMTRPTLLHFVVDTRAIMASHVHGNRRTQSVIVKMFIRNRSRSEILHQAWTDPAMERIVSVAMSNSIGREWRMSGDTTRIDYSMSKQPGLYRCHHDFD